MRKKKIDDHLDLRERRCARCKKVFIAAPYHIYREKSGSKYYCSYTCWIHSGKKRIGGQEHA